MGVLVLSIAAAFASASALARTITLNELTQLMVKKNPDIISSRAEIEQAQIEERGVGRLSTSTFSAATNYYDLDLIDRATPADFDQQRTQFDLGLTGRSQSWGLGYSLTYTHSQQVQESFETISRVTKDGQELKLGFEYDFLQNSGSSVGKLPFDVAEQRTRLASVQQKSVYQNLLRDLFGRYLTAMLLQQKIENAQALLLETEELNKHYKTLYSEGRLSRVEFLSSEIQISSSRAVITRLRSESKQALRELVTFAGGLEDLTVGEELQLKPLSLDYITAEKVSSQRAKERAGNFEVQALDHQRKVAELEAAGLKDKLRPQFKMIGGHSWLKNPPADSFISPDDTKVDQWYVGLKLEVPLDKIGPRSDLAVKRVQASNFDTRRRLLLQNNELRVQNLFEELSALETQLKSTEELEKLETERFKATIPLVERSSAARLDIFDFQNRIRDQRAQLVETRVEILRRRAEILYLSGIPILR